MAKAVHEVITMAVPPQRYCVTGASGFVAGHLVAALLARGHTVVGTVRSAAAAAHLLTLPGAADRLTLMTADLLQAGSFDAAVAGCDGVFHTAPCEPDDLIEPAVTGTLAVYAAAAGAPSVQRVVTTSSFATIVLGHDHTVNPTPYTEAEWNTVSQPTPGDTMSIYRVAKVRAERAGWAFMAAAPRSFDLVTLNPPIVVGPFLDGYRRKNDSSMIICEFASGEQTTVPAGGFGYADVRDVAQAHIAAMETPSANGRYLIAAGRFFGGAPVTLCLYHAELLALLRTLRPHASQALATRPAPGPTVFPPYFDCRRAAADLAWAPRPLVDTIAAQVQSLVDAGFLPP